MVVITIELWPSGNPAERRHLGTMTIANDGRGTATSGNYDVMLSKFGHPKAVWRRGRVEGFPRRRLGPYDLMLRALYGIVGHRNPETQRDDTDVAAHYQ